MFDSKQPYVSFLWNERTAQYSAQFYKDYKLVDEKRLTADEELTLDTYVSLVEEDHSMDVPASELWGVYHHGDLLFEDEDNGFLRMLRQIMPEPEEVKS